MSEFYDHEEGRLTDLTQDYLLSEAAQFTLSVKFNTVLRK